MAPPAHGAHGLAGVHACEGGAGAEEQHDHAVIIPAGSGHDPSGMEIMADRFRRNSGQPLEIRGGQPLLRRDIGIDNCFALLPRQALHAQVLGFVHPATGRDMYFESPIPADMAALLDKWRRYVNVRDLPEEDL